MTKQPRIWIFLGHRRGDNGQLLALGEALGLPFETRTLHYRGQARLLMKLSRISIGHVTKESRRWLMPPWPDLIIGIGRRSVPVALWVQRQSGGATRLVRLGHPRSPSRLFDLVITTPQYPVAPDENVITLPLAMNRFRKPPVATAREQKWLAARPRPHLLLSLGGTAPMWRLDLAALRDAAVSLGRRAHSEGGTLIVVGSPRTPDEAWTVVSDAAPGSACVDREVRYPVLLADADAHFVTADSVSMISEAIMTGKPVGLIAVEADARGKRKLGNRDPATTRLRDPRRFWIEVAERGLAGTVNEPRSDDFEDPVETAVAAVRQRLGSLFE